MAVGSADPGMSLQFDCKAQPMVLLGKHSGLAVLSSLGAHVQKCPQSMALS